MPFPPEIVEPVRRWLLSGEFDFEDDVLKAALHALDERDHEIAAIQAGLDDMHAERVHSLDEFLYKLRWLWPW